MGPLKELRHSLFSCEECSFRDLIATVVSRRQMLDEITVSQLI